MPKMPKNGDSIKFRRPLVDPQIKVGNVVGEGFNAVAVETGIKGTNETTILCVPLTQVFHQVR